MTKRIRFNDQQCRAFLREMQSFGYPKLKLDEVRRQADRYADGEDVSGNVIGAMLQRSAEELEAASR